MIKRTISIILLLTSTTAFAADQSATIPNSRILNEDPASARQKVDAASLGKLEEDAALQNDAVRAAILNDLARSQPRATKIPVAENYGLIFEKVKQAVHDDERIRQRALWIRTEKFLEEANDPGQWNIPENEKNDVLRYSLMTDEELQVEIDKKFSFARYRLVEMDWHLFSNDFSGNFIGKIIACERFIEDYQYRFDHEGGNPKLLELIKANQEHRDEALKMLVMFREWVYRHWDDSVRPRSIKPSRVTTTPIVAGSLGRVSSERLKAIRVAESYNSIYAKIDPYLSRNSQRAEAARAWRFAKQFLKDANDPSQWFKDENGEEQAETRKFAWMSTEDLEKEFARLHSFPNYSLRSLNWEHFMENAVGNFMIGILQSKELIAEEGFTEGDAAAFRERLTAGRIFREWVFRHWDSSPRLASYTFFRSGGSSLGIVTPSKLENYYEKMMTDFEIRTSRARNGVETAKQAYQKEMDLFRSGADYVSEEDIEAKRLQIDSAEERLKMLEAAPKFFEKVRNPSVWMENENEIERNETKRFSSMTNDQLETEIVKFHTFPDYSLRTINGRDLVGDAYIYLVYYTEEVKKRLEEEGIDPRTDIGYKNKMTAQRIFREWVYRHWDNQPKLASYTFFAQNSSPVVQAFSLGKQVLVFQMNSGLNKEILDKTADLMRSNPDKSVVFVVGRRAEGNAVRKALKARGLSVKEVPFEVNALRSQDDREQFSKYVHGLQAKFPDKNAVAVIADFRILAGLNSKEIVSVARDKAGQGSNHAPVDIAKIKNIEREGTDVTLFNLGWNILSASSPTNFRDQIEQEASTGIFLIRFDVLKNLLQRWLIEQENSRQLQAAA